MSQVCYCRSSKGLYHAPYATKDEAIAGHALMVETIKRGLEFGGGVTEDAFGTPTITPEEWAKRAAKIGEVMAG